jgi:hypothetical protein
MKKSLLAILLLSLVSIASAAQKSETSMIKIRIKNSSFLPKRITIVSYWPGSEGNETMQVTMLPKAEKVLRYMEGTKIYLADAKQVSIVMSGKRIDRDAPFLVVKRENAGKTFAY